jgi:hypothetical protein
MPPSRSLAVEGLIAEYHFVESHKAIPANQGLAVEDHFIDSNNMVPRGKEGARRGSFR